MLVVYQFYNLTYNSRKSAEEDRKMLFVKPEWKAEAEKRMESIPDWYNIAEASLVLGVSDSYIKRLCRDLNGVAYKSGKSFFLNEVQIQYLMDKIEKR